MRTVLTILFLIGLPLPLSAQDQFFDAAGVQLRYVDAGAGEPVVLVHGLGNSVETWTEPGVVQELAKHYRIIAFDLRGHGRSSKPHDAKAYGHEMGEDIIRL